MCLWCFFFSCFELNLGIIFWPMIIIHPFFSSFLSIHPEDMMSRMRSMMWGLFLLFLLFSLSIFFQLYTSWDHSHHHAHLLWCLKNFFTSPSFIFIIHYLSSAHLSSLCSYSPFFCSKRDSISSNSILSLLLLLLSSSLFSLLWILFVFIITTTPRKILTSLNNNFFTTDLHI